MTREWITKNIKKLIAENPGAPEIAELETALKNGEIYGMVVKVREAAGQILPPTYEVRSWLNIPLKGHW